LLAGLAALLAPVPPVAAQQQAPPSTAKAGPAVERLKGRWQRLEAAYFNPRPIHVGKAGWSKEGQAVKVYVELRDVNYPGSNYTLIYDVGSDRLVGRYFQAVARETFDVSFVRQKPRAGARGLPTTHPERT
jgi:hypothetical protein